MRITLALLVGVALCASCAIARDDRPPAANPAAVDRAGAPPITVPHNLAIREQDPCGTLLTPQRLEELGYDVPGRADTSISGSRSCIWRDGDLGRQIVAMIVLKEDLFVQTYRNPGFPIVRPLDIGGLPAVDTLSSPDAPTCTTTVGVADGQSLDITALAAIGPGGRPASDPCEEGHRVAEAIVSTLPPK